MRDGPVECAERKVGRGAGLAVLAVQHVRRMRGGAQSHLMLGSDGELWVVKFQGNPQGTRVLANEYLATKLAAAAGLSVPACDVVEVTEWLAAHTPELYAETGSGRERYRGGLHFGSKYAGGLMPGQVIDYLPEEQLREVRNLAEFAGMLVIDKWTGNVNGRQAVFTKAGRERKYRAAFIDQGYCFGGTEWRFPDAALRGVFPRNAVYAGVTGWESFAPWLGRVEGMAPEAMWEAAEGAPPEWYGGDPGEMERLVAELIERRGRVRELIEAFRRSERAPFPNWGRAGVAARKLGEEIPKAGSRTQMGGEGWAM